jgi:uncharacterized membrane protein
MLLLARLLFVLALVVAAVVIGVTTDQLPVQIASHFGAGGAPNGWMTRSGYLLFIFAFAIGIPLLVVLSMSVLPRVMDKAINIPNRDYWLDPARREETLRYLESHAYWLGSLIVVFIAAIHLLLIEANRTQPPHLPGVLFGTMLATFLAAMGIWTFTMILRFRRTP